jgi:hypothetical protein
MPITDQRALKNASGVARADQLGTAAGRQRDAAQ